MRVKLLLSGEIHMLPKGGVRAVLYCHSHILSTDTMKDVCDNQKYI